MSWLKRLRPVIRLTSPQGKEFRALWKGDEETGEKRLGKHSYPDIDLEVIQDMGMKSPSVPIEIIFDGADNDVQSRLFVRTLYERGIWQVYHPVDGLLKLIVVSYKRPRQPVDSGNVTIVEVEFIEPLEEISPVPDAASGVKSAADKANEESISGFKKMAQKTAAGVTAARNTVQQGLKTVSSAMQTVNSRILNIQKQLDELLMAEYLDLQSIASCFVAIVEAPGLIVNTAVQKVRLFSNLGKSFITNMKNAIPFSSSAANNGKSSEMILNSFTTAMAKSIITTPPQTRREALQILNEYAKFTNDCQSALEDMAALTAGNNIEDQFIARSASGQALSELNTAVSKYLINSLFNLQIERVIELETPRSPIEIVITEMKAAKDNADDYYKMFCQWNSLHGRDLLLLNKGSEVIVYG